MADGWTENAFLNDQTTGGDYGNDQRAMLLWYHDYALGTTRFDVYAGRTGWRLSMRQASPFPGS